MYREAPVIFAWYAIIAVIMTFSVRRMLVRIRSAYQRQWQYRPSRLDRFFCLPGRDIIDRRASVVLKYMAAVHGQCPVSITIPILNFLIPPEVKRDTLVDAMRTEMQILGVIGKKWTNAPYTVQFGGAILLCEYTRLQDKYPMYLGSQSVDMIELLHTCNVDHEGLKHAISRRLRECGIYGIE